MRFEGTSAYIATDDLKVAVNAATLLRRPLLVKGEPGTGKTVLAEEIARATGAPLRALVRTKEPEYLAQGLDNPQLSDAQLAAALHATPALIERPILVTAKGARLGRPVEKILEVLD